MRSDITVGVVLVDPEPPWGTDWRFRGGSPDFGGRGPASVPDHKGNVAGQPEVTGNDLLVGGLLGIEPAGEPAFLGPRSSD